MNNFLCLCFLCPPVLLFFSLLAVLHSWCRFLSPVSHVCLPLLPRSALVIITEYFAAKKKHNSFAFLVNNETKNRHFESAQRAVFWRARVLFKVIIRNHTCLLSIVKNMKSALLLQINQICSPVCCGILTVMSSNMWAVLYFACSARMVRLFCLFPIF